MLAGRVDSVGKTGFFAPPPQGATKTCAHRRPCDPNIANSTPRPTPANTERYATPLTTTANDAQPTQDNETIFSTPTLTTDACSSSTAPDHNAPQFSPGLRPLQHHNITDCTTSAAPQQQPPTPKATQPPHPQALFTHPHRRSAQKPTETDCPRAHIDGPPTRTSPTRRHGRRKISSSRCLSRDATTATSDLNSTYNPPVC